MKTKRLPTILFSFLGCLCLSAQDNGEMEKFMTYWTGSFSNERQVYRENKFNEPDYPEAVRQLRDMTVYRLDARELGENVLFLEEVKMNQPTKAHRQRVMVMVWHEDSKEIEVQQFFFRQGPTYDRGLLDPAVVSQMKKTDFIPVSKCNLFFTWDETLNRFKGGMRAKACEYKHEVSGLVYAEFDMILDENRLWYRDRSIIIEDSSIRGEIDGFSWLRFDKLSDAPKLANGDRISKKQMKRRMVDEGEAEGIWDGTFHRVDSLGKTMEQFKTRIIVRYLEDGNEYDYHQTNVLKFGQPDEKRIDSYGKWDVNGLRFSNFRLDGFSPAFGIDDANLSTAFTMSFKDGSGLEVSEIITYAKDRRSRIRTSQYMKDGKILRRTMISEKKVSDDPYSASGR